MKHEVYPRLSFAQFKDIVQAIRQVRVAVLGDFCLDGYFVADMKKSVLSRESPHFPLPIVAERFSPGAAGNVSLNLWSLQPQSLKIFGVIGQDWRGQLLRSLHEQVGIETSSMLAFSDVTTNAYLKPIRTGISEVSYEDPRLDFENHQLLPKHAEAALLHELTAHEDTFDVLCVCDQMRNGCVSDRIRQQVHALAQAGKIVIVDTRSRLADYRNVIVKPNEVECACAFQIEMLDKEDLSFLAELVRRLSLYSGKEAILTLGEKGCFVSDGSKSTHVPAWPVKPPLDICGAGDTFMAAFALAYGAGTGLAASAAFACLASGVSVQTLGGTGIVTTSELEQALTHTPQQEGE